MGFTRIRLTKMFAVLIITSLLSACSSPQPTVAPYAPTNELSGLQTTLPSPAEAQSTKTLLILPTSTSVSKEEVDEKVSLNSGQGIRLEPYKGYGPPNTGWENVPVATDPNLWFLGLETSDRNSLVYFHLVKVILEAGGGVAYETIEMDTAGATEVLYQVTPQTLPMPGGNYCLVKTDSSGVNTYWCFRLPDPTLQQATTTGPVLVKQWTIPDENVGRLYPRHDGTLFILLGQNPAESVVMVGPDGKIERSVNFPYMCGSLRVSEAGDFLCVAGDGVLYKVSFAGEVAKVDLGYSGGIDLGQLNINGLVVRENRLSENNQTKKVVTYYDDTGQVTNQVELVEGCKKDLITIGPILCVTDGRLLAYDPNGKVLFDGDPQPVDLQEKFSSEFTPWGDLFLTQEKKDALGNTGQTVYLRLRNNELTELSSDPFQNFPKLNYEGEDAHTKLLIYFPKTGRIFNYDMNGRTLWELDRDLNIIDTISVPAAILLTDIGSDGSIYYMDVQNKQLSKYAISK